MIGDDERLRRGEGEFEAGDIFGHVPRQRRDPRRLLGVGGIVGEHEAVVLDRRAAARGGDDDRLQAAVVDLARPGVDVGARLRERRASRPM